MTFSKEGSKYISRLTATDEPLTVQVIRTVKGYFTVYAAIDGLTPVSIFCQTERKDLIFQLDVPAGIEVTLESETEVTDAKTLQSGI